MKNEKVKNNRFFPNSLRFISSCIKTVSTNVRTAGASVAASLSGDSDDQKDEVLWASFDRIELTPSFFKHVLLLGYSNGFQVLDVEDSSNVCELVSRRDDPVTFLQMQPIPEKSEGHEGFRGSHPLLLVVAGEESKGSAPLQRDGYIESQIGNNPVISPTAVRFYSLRSHNYIHVLRFRSTIYMVRCSPRIVAVGLATQICCFDALTLENKFSVLTYPVPQLVGQGTIGINVGYGPMAVGSRWLAYASNSLLLPNTGRLSPQCLTPSPGVSPSTSPGSGTLMARYAMESSKHLASGLINLGDMGYKTLYKYCHDFLPDGSSSPVSSNPIWKVGRPNGLSTESDIAGMVVVKDFISKAVVSQFRAHTSPISALCFDPSGTLLVTASIHGNNINIFRIMPALSQNGSGNQQYDWSSSHVHLYKLHRGLTSAVIQDVCFSHFSQWIAIVSSRGTCHIFVLSPFGGESGLQIQNYHVDGPTLSPILSLPWWYTPSFMIHQQALTPPPPVTLSVISRIKNGNTGWLNCVNNSNMPSGTFAAIFHSSITRNKQSSFPLKINNALEHLLVYAPSGHLVQFELLPSLGDESSENTVTNGTDEDIRVRAEPIQWWDVCRRTDWIEREESVYGISQNSRECSELLIDTSDCEDNDSDGKDFAKTHERSHWYLANAEVQMNCGRIPIWQKSKICFYVMNPSEAVEHISDEDFTGETEIERINVQEVEIRRRDLLPVFDHLQRIQSSWTDSGFAEGRYSEFSKEPRGAAKDNFISHKSSRKTEFLSSTPPSQSSFEGSCVSNSLSSIKSGILSDRRIITKETNSSDSNLSSHRSDLSMNILDEGVHEDLRDPLVFGQSFQEEYCKALVMDEKGRQISEVDSGAGNSSCASNLEKSDDEDMLGCVFAFSEEG